MIERWILALPTEARRWCTNLEASVVVSACVACSGCDAGQHTDRVTPPTPSMAPVTKAPAVALVPTVDTTLRTTRAYATFIGGELNSCTDHLYIRVGPSPANSAESQAGLETLADSNEKPGKDDVALHKSCAETFPQRVVTASCAVNTQSTPTALGVYARREGNIKFYSRPSDEVMKACLKVNGTWGESPH